MKSKLGGLHLLAMLLLIGIPRQRVFALVVVPPATNDNVTPPPDDPGWLNVGDNGVYLGNRWVITALNVGAQTTTFPGVGVFSVVPGSAIRLQNPSGQGLTTDTDLLMYRLVADPGLPSLEIGAVSPGQGDTVTMIGAGRSITPSTPETQWDLNWNQVPFGGIHRGYASGAGRKLWGTNVVENSAPVAVHTFVYGDALSFFTIFDGPSVVGTTATLHETQMQSGDAGSAVFDKIGGKWLLSGVDFAIAAYPNQPSPDRNAVYGDYTYAVDLSQYRDQIVARMPEPTSIALASFSSVTMAIYCFVTRLRNVTCLQIGTACGMKRSGGE
jgi:hypothetical protein